MNGLLFVLRLLCSLKRDASYHILSDVCTDTPFCCVISGLSPTRLSPTRLLLIGKQDAGFVRKTLKFSDDSIFDESEENTCRRNWPQNRFPRGTSTDGSTTTMSLDSRLGRYAFSVPEAVQRGQLRPLRTSSEAIEELS